MRTYINYTTMRTLLLLAVLVYQSHALISCGTATTLSSTEIYANGTWAAGAVMTNSLQRHTATLTPTGGVLVAGGITGASVASGVAQVYAAGAWGSLITMCYLHTDMNTPLHS